ncbi:hypothetical protein EH223_10570 [candidate division KSB1 bacterium]|nr:hypothetical protein [candidate division KSB1 bacterium]RQW03200.1 MAG: hypothetical protein EH223_10570 [candidate division KSB1 bacterium]
MTELIIQLISGAVGGNIAGGVLKNLNLGPVWNSVVGILGGGLGGQLLNAIGLLGQSGGGLDIGSIIGNVASSGVGGAVLLVIVGLIKKALKK